VAGQYALGLRMDFEELGRNVKLVAIGHHLGAATDGVDRNLVAAVDCQDRLQLRLEEAPMAGFGAGMQVVMRHGPGPVVFICFHQDSSLPGLTRQSILFQEDF
jgi:hypothetical protein